MARFYSPQECQRKADQHWEMAGLARQDNDHTDARYHQEQARVWVTRALQGGYEKEA